MGQGTVKASLARTPVQRAPVIPARTACLARTRVRATAIATPLCREPRRENGAIDMNRVVR